MYLLPNLSQLMVQINKKIYRNNTYSTHLCVLTPWAYRTETSCPLPLQTLVSMHPEHRAACLSHCSGLR
uniref:Uncharacterized protein n=1 Tax=Anguilla anguilla TaxID=7936 RepID=A0A0E9RFX9_ANGAN